MMNERVLFLAAGNPLVSLAFYLIIALQWRRDATAGPGAANDLWCNIKY